MDLKIKLERNDYGKGFIYYHPDEKGKFRCWEMLDESLYQALEDLVQLASDAGELTAFNEWLDDNHHSFKIPDMILQDYIRNNT